MRFVRKLIFFVLIILAITAEMSATAAYMVFYGPFTGLKELTVTSVMTTLSHQYLVEIFLSDQEIQCIMEKNKIKEPVQNSDVNLITISTDLPEPIQFFSTEYEDQDDFLKEKLIERRILRENKTKIEKIEIKAKNFSGHMLIIHDPSRVRIVTTDKLGQIGVKLKDMVTMHNVLGGINAGGFMDENGEGFGGVPTECIIADSKIIFGNENKKYDIIGFNKENILVLGRYSLTEAKEIGIRDAIAFSPYLVVNGEAVIKDGDGGWGINPRTAIGQRRDGKVLMLVIDGRQLHSIGATLKETQEVMLEYGAYNAANLDGGSSTVMYYEGKLVNKPCSPYGERFLPSAFVVDKLKTNQ